MKAFHKWWNEPRGLEETEVIRGTVCKEQLVDDLAELAWRSALEFIYDQLGYNIEDKRIKDIIEEELKDE